MSRVGKKVYFIAYYFVLLDNNDLMRDITQKMWRLPEYLQEQLFKKSCFFHVRTSLTNNFIFNF